MFKRPIPCVELRKVEIMQELECYKDRLLEEMSGVDKLTLAKLRDIISDYYDAKKNITEVSKYALEVYTESIDALKEGYLAAFKIEMEDHINGSEIDSFIRNKVNEIIGVTLVDGNEVEY